MNKAKKNQIVIYSIVLMLLFLMIPNLLKDNFAITNTPLSHI